jgi:hypothetical protein
MHDNYSIRIQRKDGFTLQTVQNVSINTAWRILPWLLEDLVTRGEGYDPAAELDHSTTRDEVRKYFELNQHVWFNQLADNGYVSLFDLSVTMDHS